MKVKILLPPLIIVSCIALMVWLVYPAYTNGVDGWKEKRDKLTSEKNNLDDAQKKAENVSRMVAQLGSNKVDQDTIATYIPDELKEEEIIDNLNFIASNEGLSVVKLSVKPETVVQQEVPTDMSGNPVVDVSGGNPSATEDVTVKAKNYNVEFSVVGNYEKIKNVLDKVYKLKRYNSFKTLEIAANETPGADGKKAAPTDSLKADMILSFDVLKKFSQTVSMNNPIFSQTSFDMKVAQEIRDKKSVDVLKMSIDQAGRTNPFIP
ncbi:MAG: hypothetical protein WCV59_05570 [Parcubacteria group bacterium]|jgi:Tfp pilus assembly protein PilO